MFKYHNANPLGRHVNDCTVRAISLATGSSWDETYQELGHFTRLQGIMPDDVVYIDDYLSHKFNRICCPNKVKMTVGDFIKMHPYGVYLITMNGHITCCIDGIVYDTFNPCDRLIWDAYKVKE